MDQWRLEQQPLVITLVSRIGVMATLGVEAALSRNGQSVVFIGAYRGTPSATYETAKDNGTVYVSPLLTYKQCGSSGWEAVIIILMRLLQERSDRIDT